MIIRKKEINDILIKEISKKYSQNENKIKNFLNKSVSLFYIRKLIGLTKNNLEKKEIKNKNKLFDELEKTIFLMKNLSENLNANFKIVYIPDILKFKNKEYANLRPSYLFDIKNFEETSLMSFQNIQSTLKAFDKNKIDYIGLKLLPLPSELSISKRIDINSDAIKIIKKAIKEI